MDEEPTGGPDDDADAGARRDEQRAMDAIVDLPWDEDLPVALGDDSGFEPALDDGGADAGEGAVLGADGHAPGVDSGASEAEGAGDEPAAGDEPGEGEEGEEADAVDAATDADHGDDMGELSETDYVGGRRNALPRRVESWRSRSATGAIATAIAMGLQQVFEPERRRPAAVAEAPSDPYDDDDPITVDYVPDDAEATTVHVKPWLLQKGEPG